MLLLVLSDWRVDLVGVSLVGMDVSLLGVVGSTCIPVRLSVAIREGELLAELYLVLDSFDFVVTSSLSLDLEGCGGSGLGCLELSAVGVVTTATGFML